MIINQLIKKQGIPTTEMPMIENNNYIINKRNFRNA